MRFKLFECHITRPSGLVSGYLIASGEAQAERVVKEREQALGITPLSIDLTRVDETLPEELRDGLDELLEAAPMGFVSRCDFGWVPHVGPVHRLRLFRSEDHRGMEILAVAPNAEVAAALFVNTLLPQKRYIFQITDVTDTFEAKRLAELEPLLVDCQVGIADFDEERGCWFVW